MPRSLMQIPAPKQKTLVVWRLRQEWITNWGRFLIVIEESNPEYGVRSCKFDAMRPLTRKEGYSGLAPMPSK